MNRSRNPKLFKRVTFFMKLELIKKLKIFCIENNTTMSEYIEKLVEELK